MPRGSGTILGIMPVVVDLTFTSGDGWGIDDDVDIDGIYWERKDGTVGAPIPDHIWDRAEPLRWTDPLHQL